MHWSFTEVVENATEKLLRDWEGEMPIFLDRHDMSGLTAADIAEAHRKDLEIQADYGVNFITYWFDESRGSGFCLIDAPDKETAMRVHEEAHGDVALDVIDVDLSAVQAFLGRIADPELAEEEHLIEPAFRSVMFTDLVDSTAMTAQLGDKRSLEIVRSHDSIVRSSLRSTGGREVKHTGDGIMAAFDDANSSVECARSVLGGFTKFNESSDVKMHVRVGIDAGEPVADSNDLFGETVQRAARLCAEAETDQIVISEPLYELVKEKFPAVNLGERQLKGFAEASRLYAVSAH